MVLCVLHVHSCLQRVRSCRAKQSVHTLMQCCAACTYQCNQCAIYVCKCACFVVVSVAAIMACSRWLCQRVLTWTGYTCQCTVLRRAINSCSLGGVHHQTHTHLKQIRAARRKPNSDILPYLGHECSNAIHVGGRTCGLVCKKSVCHGTRRCRQKRAPARCGNMLSSHGAQLK